MKNKVMVINTLAIPVMTNSFNITNWILAEIKMMDTLVRKQITYNRNHRTRVNTERLNVKRKWTKSINSTRIDLQIYIINIY